MANCRSISSQSRECHRQTVRWMLVLASESIYVEYHFTCMIMKMKIIVVEVEVTLRLTVNKSVSMFWYRAALWDLRPAITSCRNVAVWNLRSCICGAPSLTTGRVCNLQCNHSMVRAAQSPKPYFTVSFKTPQPGGPGSRIYIPQEQVALLYPWALSIVVLMIMMTMQTARNHCQQSFFYYYGITTFRWVLAVFSGSYSYVGLCGPGISPS
jgi:hypothetical protein